MKQYPPLNHVAKLNNDVQWFAYYGIREGFLNPQACREIHAQLGDEADLLTFGEHVLDERLTDDYELVQELVDKAHERDCAGETPPRDPFKHVTKKSVNTKGFYLKRDAELATESSHDELSAGVVVAKPATQCRNGNDVSLVNNEQRIDSASRQQEGVASGPVTHGSPTECLANDMPSFSLNVSQAWPDFSSLADLADEALRQVVVQVLKEAQRNGASDLHLSAGARPFMRQYRNVHYIADTILSHKDALRLNTALLTETQKRNFEVQQDLDYALALDANNRFRVNLMRHKEGAAGTYRIIPDRIQTLEELGFENTDVIKKLLTYHNGLVLVTGPVGSGKTVTLAALVDELNRTRQDHIISVEAPVEIVQYSQQCQITQREVGPQTKTFQSALKGALRQDPDIIVVGEMRDLETIEMAISASETGHLVIGTMHTQDSATTLNRLLDVFPAAQQTQIRAMVSESLKGIICQRLLPNTRGGVSLACELLLNSAAVANMIRESKSEGLVNAIETGSSAGMQLMDKSIMKLYREQCITQEVAVANMTNRVFINQIKPPTPVAVASATATASATAMNKKKFFGVGKS